MIYLSLLVVIICMFIVYKERGSAKFFLLFLTLGWIVSLFSFIIYLQFLKGRELYLYMFWKILYVKSTIPQIAVPFNLNMQVVIFCMNFGVLLFIYSCLCFTIAFTRPLKNNLNLYIVLGVFIAAELVIYCPWFYQMIYRYIFTGHLKEYISYTSFYRIERNIYFVTKTINIAYLISSIILLVYHYYKTPRLRYFRDYSMLIFSGLITVTSLFATIMWWAPKRLISISILSDYIHILPVSIVLEGKMLEVFPYIAFVSFAVLLFAMYKFNDNYLRLENMKKHIIKSIDISTVGVRFFAHMVKNYAMAVSIDAEWLKTRLTLDGEQAEYFDSIIGSSNEMIQKMDDIKSKFSLISLNMSLANIRVPVDEALQKVNLQGIELVYKCDEHIPSVPMDKKHMCEVVLNMINNAIHAMNNTMEKTISIHIFQEKSWGIISISDTGIGIEQQNIDKIFNPFYTTKDKRSNWGLGLSYCYRIIMAHRGKVFVESEPGVGTTFKILLPISKHK